MRKPLVIFICADPQWDRWLPEFLGHPDYEARILYGKGEEIPGRSLCGPTDAVIFLSLHSTLGNDARTGQNLRTSGFRRVVCQPESVARLAADKRMMALATRTVEGCQTPREWEYGEVRRRLKDEPDGMFVGKYNDSTKGIGLEIIRSPVELDCFVTRAGSDAVIQSFIPGDEYSVNLVRNESATIVLEPVYKGPTSRKGIHPCRRVRYCPWPFLCPILRGQLLSISRRYADAVSVTGLAELEFIVQDKEIYFLEMNPRLSGTMRMGSIACQRSIFSDMAKLFLSDEEPALQPCASRFTAEIPITSAAEAAKLTGLKGQIPLWLSSRVTVAADDWPALEANLTLVLARLDNPEVGG